jgi:GNAT superfamily N-acetyltransferase
VLGDSLARIAAYDRAVHEALPPEPHWYLGILACHPERRGAGLGRRVAELGLAEAQRSGHPAALETTSFTNVAIYESAGWSVRSEIEDPHGLSVWVMTHGG